MARVLHRLTALDLRNIAAPGRHSDGGGLYLIVDKGGAKRWAFIFRWEGRLREMGLGGINGVGLKEAREAAAGARSQLANRINPITARRAAAAVPTFGELAEDMISGLERGWRNPKHRQQWRNTLKTYAAPIWGALVSEVGTEDVLRCLRPIWTEKRETASRVRGRIERVLEAAKARAHRQGENPARWRGHLEHLLAKRQRGETRHHAALPFAQLPEFMARLRDREAMAALGLEFVILTASRPGEVTGAKWPEIDREAKVWTVPAARIKGGRPHRVPLCPRALAILDHVKPAADSAGYVFPGGGRGKPLSSNAFRALLKRLKVDVTAHGFRSTFRDWVSEASSFPDRLAEQALAHIVGDETERAYRRGDVLDKRRRLMEAWANFCEPKGGKVVAFGRPG